MNKYILIFLLIGTFVSSLVRVLTGSLPVIQYISLGICFITLILACVILFDVLKKHN